jgi:hypothetical protein
MVREDVGRRGGFLCLALYTGSSIYTHYCIKNTSSIQIVYVHTIGHWDPCPSLLDGDTGMGQPPNKERGPCAWGDQIS